LKCKVLVVDGDQKALKRCRKHLGPEIDTEIVHDADMALEAIRTTEHPYGAVVTELMVPGMDGLELLKLVKDSSPKSGRFILSNECQPDRVIEAVNQAKVCGFAKKPIENSNLKDLLLDSLKTFETDISEVELLTQTLTGSVRLLIEILSIVNPVAFDRTTTIRPLAKQIAQKMKMRNVWECEIAAMLCQIGTVSIPKTIMQKIHDREDLEQLELKTFEQHPEFGASLVSIIPRLRNVANFIKYQNKSYNGKGYPKDEVKGETIPTGARILRVVNDFEKMRQDGVSMEDAFFTIQENDQDYDLQVVAALEEIIDMTPGYVSLNVRVAGLPIGSILSQDVHTSDGRLLIQNGHTVDEETKKKLLYHSKNAGVEEPILVRFLPSRQHDLL